MNTKKSTVQKYFEEAEKTLKESLPAHLFASKNLPELKKRNGFVCPNDDADLVTQFNDVAKKLESATTEPRKFLDKIWRLHSLENCASPVDKKKAKKGK